MFSTEEAKKAYFKDRYANNKDKYKKNAYNTWYNRAKIKFDTEFPTDEQVKETRNEYYREYRKNHPKETKDIMNNFYNNWANKEE